MKERGAAYAEFAITLPVLLFLVFSIVAMSRLLNNLAVLVPMSYESFLIGSVQSDRQVARMEGVCGVFRDFVSNDFYSSVCEEPTSSGTAVFRYNTAPFNQSVETVEVDFQPPLVSSGSFLGSLSNLRLGLSLVGPRVGTEQTIANLGQFDVILPLGSEAYDCNFNPIPQPITNPC